MSFLPNPSSKLVAQTRDKMRTLESNYAYRSAALRYVLRLKMKTKPHQELNPDVVNQLLNAILLGVCLISTAKAIGVVGENPKH